MDKTDPRWRNSETVPGCYFFFGSSQEDTGKTERKEMDRKVLEEGKEEYFIA